MQSLPASITLNGANLEVGGHKTLEDALRASGVKPKPGDFVAVDGSVIEAGKGEPFHATVNGEVATDMDTKLNNGDVVELGDGSAIEEPSETAEESIPYSIEEEGRGPIHVLEGQGADGLKRTKTGSVSGLTTEEVVQEPSNVVRRNVSPQVGEDKVVALTFDDGPWPESTAAVLDVLADQGAKATFFTVGNRIDGEGVDLVKRAAAEGHQICSHSFDHAAGDAQRRAPLSQVAGLPLRHHGRAARLSALLNLASAARRTKASFDLLRDRSPRDVVPLATNIIETTCFLNIDIAIVKYVGRAWVRPFQKEGSAVLHGR